MGVADIFIIITLFVFGLTGFTFGFVHMIGSFAGIIIAAIIAGKYFGFVAQKLGFLFGGDSNVGLIVAFVILFIVVTRLVGLVFWLINKLFNLVKAIPFVKTINRVGGAALGLFEGIILLSLAFYLLVRFPLSESINNAIAASKGVDILLGFANRMAPLLPDVVEKAQTLIN